MMKTFGRTFLLFVASLVMVPAKAAPYQTVPPEYRGDATFKNSTGTQTNAEIDSNGVTADQVRADTITNKAGTGAPPGMVPIGGMVVVMPNVHANAWQPPATGVVKDGFMRADGAAVPGSCTDCVIPAGTTMPNMINRYPRGNTNSGATGGANTQATNVAVSSHSVTQPVIAAHTVTQPVISDHASHTHSVPAHYHGFSLASSLGISGSAPSLTGTTTFVSSGTHTSGMITQPAFTVPVHSHSHSLATSLGISGAAPSLTGTTSFSSSAHTHAPGSYHARIRLFANGDMRYQYQSGVTAWTSNYEIQPGGGQGVVVSGSENEGQVIGGTSATPSASASVGISGGSYSLTGSNAVTGTVGSGVDGTTAFAATRTTDVAIGSHSTGSVGISGGSYSLTGSNTVTGTVGLPSGSGGVDGNASMTSGGSGALSHSLSTSVGVSAHSLSTSVGVADHVVTNNAVNNEPSYMEVVWVVRVK